MNDRDHIIETLTLVLHDIARLHTLLTTIYAEPTITTSRTPSRGTTRSSQQEHYTTIREHIATCWAEIEKIARNWQTARGEHNIETDPALYLATHLNWAATSYENLAELETTISAIHGTYQKLAKETDEISDHLCPMCGKTQLHYRNTDSIYYCHKCDGSWTPSQLHTLTHYKLTTNVPDIWISRKDASEIYHVSRTLLRWHIHQGNLTTHDGKINAKEIAELASHKRNTPPS